MSNTKPANTNDDDNRLIQAGQALYDALVKCDANATTLEALGRSIFAKTPWKQLPASSRLVMVRSILMMEIPREDPKPEIDEADAGKDAG